MSTIMAIDPMLERIEALLDRLDWTARGACTVPGCIHHHADARPDAWAGDPPAG